MKHPNSIAVSIALVVVFASGLSACGKSEPAPPPKAKDTVFGEMVGTKEKAKVDTEKAMEVNKQKLEETMKKEEEGAK